MDGTWGLKWSDSYLSSSTDIGELTLSLVAPNKFGCKRGTSGLRLGLDSQPKLLAHSVRERVVVLLLIPAPENRAGVLVT